MNADQPSTAARYFELCKPKVVALIVFTSVVGMFLAVPAWPPMNALIAGTAGIALAAASAAAINHPLDQRIDAVMAGHDHLAQGGGRPRLPPASAPCRAVNWT